MNAITHETTALSLLRAALADFYIHDRALLRLGLGETALTFRLGLHLARRAPWTWDVDAEYDREGEAGARKRRGAMPELRTMRPDLVIHKRGLKGRANNLLCVEVKRLWSRARGRPRRSR